MSKTSTMSIDDVRAQFANSTQTYWVCPITQKRFRSDNQAGIEAHQAKVISDLEGKERTKQRAKLLRELNSELGKVQSLEQLRDWALRRVQLDDETMVAQAMPTMSVHQSKANAIGVLPYDTYVRLQGASTLTATVKNALGARQGKALDKNVIGKGEGSFWFMAVPTSSGLGKAIWTWSSCRAKKLTQAEKDALLFSNDEYRDNTNNLKALSVRIHVLREEARALVVAQEKIRNNALTVLPSALQ